MSMYGLGTVLLISAGTGRYGLAGSVSAAGSIGGAACAPQLGRLVDRLGQRRVLVPVCVTFALAVAGLIGGGHAARAGLDAVPVRHRRRRHHAADRADGPRPLVGAAGRVAAAAYRVLAGVGRRRAVLRGRPGGRDGARHPGAPGGGRRLRRRVRPARVAVVRLPAVDRAAGQRGARRADGPAPTRRPRGPGARGAARRGRLAAPGLVVLVPVYLFLGAMFVVGRPEHGRLRHASFGHKATGRRHPRLLRARQRDRRPLVRRRGPGGRPPGGGSPSPCRSPWPGCARSGRCRTCWC